MTALAHAHKDSDFAPSAKPVLKWAGGKGQLLPTISRFFPSKLGTKTRHFIEPFIGGGAVFFHLYNQNLIDRAILMDNNRDLVLLYNTIKRKPYELINLLHDIQLLYFKLSEEKQKEYYYSIRERYNNPKTQSSDIERSAYTVFLNRTCFNGLYRVNSKQEFNVPHGNYKNPRIADKDNILQVSAALQIAEIIHADFAAIEDFAGGDTFVYYDPPYRPISKTSSFTAYSGGFNDRDQMRLAQTFTSLHHRGVQQMLSNSDPLSACEDTFFEDIYAEFHRHRIQAKRMISADSTKRGTIFELLVTNYVCD